MMIRFDDFSRLRLPPADGRPRLYFTIAAPTTPVPHRFHESAPALLFSMLISRPEFCLRLDFGALCLSPRAASFAFESGD